MREPSSEGFFGTGTLGYIRFFRPYNHTVGQDLLIEVVLALALQSAALTALQLPAAPLLQLQELPADLFAGAGGEVGLDEGEVGAVEVDQLRGGRTTSKNLSSSWEFQGAARVWEAVWERRMRCTRILPTSEKRVSDCMM